MSYLLHSKTPERKKIWSEFQEATKKDKRNFVDAIHLALEEYTKEIYGTKDNDK